MTNVWGLPGEMDLPVSRIRHSIEEPSKEVLEILLVLLDSGAAIKRLRLANAYEAIV